MNPGRTRIFSSNSVIDNIDNQNLRKQAHFQVTNTDIIYLNIQGLSTNITKPEIYALKTKPEIILLSETHITGDISDCEINIPNYTCYRCDSVSRHTGGVAAYVRKGVNATVICNQVLAKNTSFLVLSVVNGIKKVIYGVLYHSPNSSESDFLQFFETVCETILSESFLNVIVGDFNITIICKLRVIVTMTSFQH